MMISELLLAFKASTIYSKYLIMDRFGAELTNSLLLYVIYHSKTCWYYWLWSKDRLIL